MYEWDPIKYRINQRKHGIPFDLVIGVFEDPSAITFDDCSDEEERQVTIGMDDFGRILVIVFTWRDEVIRIISARKATKREIEQYESQL